VPEVDAPRGSRLRVRIGARSVAIALWEPPDTSIQNIFPGRVTAITDGPGQLQDVHMDIGCPLLARITPRALQALALTPGKAVYALVKSVAVSRGHLNAALDPRIDSSG
jgi:molybdate transport system ATP-binding protein